MGSPQLEGVEPSPSTLAPLASPRVYLLEDEDLVLTAWNSLAGLSLYVVARMMLPCGDVKRTEVTFTPTSDRALNLFRLQLPAGWVIDVSVAGSSTSLKRGQCFVELALEQPTALADLQVKHTVLAADYVAAGQHLAWPGSPVRSSLDGCGVIRVIAGTDPAAGNDFSETVPTGARWRLINLHVALTTSIAAANRNPLFIMDNGTTPFFELYPSAVQTASLTVHYQLSNGLALAAASSGLATLPLPNAVILGAGFRFYVATTALQAGDDWAAPWYQVEEWIEP